MNDKKSQLTIFIGSGEASLLERKVFACSIKETSPDCQIVIYNGTHDTLEYEDGRIERLNTPLEIKYLNVTEFSNFRWFIPAICNFKGRALYVDSDMICFSDLGIFQDIDMQDCHLMARSDAYNIKGKWGYDPEGAWALSMCLIDCEKFHWTAQELFQGITDEHYSYKDLHYMKPKFTNYYSIKLCDLPPHWNDLDRYTSETKLIHYTNLMTQPWKFTAHKHGSLWIKHLKRYLAQGCITGDDVNKSIGRAYARPNILQGNWVPSSLHPFRDVFLLIPWGILRFRAAIIRLTRMNKASNK